MWHHATANVIPNLWQNLVYFLDQDHHETPKGMDIRFPTRLADSEFSANITQNDIFSKNGVVSGFMFPEVCFPYKPSRYFTGSTASACEGERQRERLGTQMVPNASVLSKALRCRPTDSGCTFCNFSKMCTFSGVWHHYSTRHWCLHKTSWKVNFFFSF